MHFSAVLFDGDGVIFDTEELSVIAFLRAMETFGLHFTRPSVQRWVGMGTKPIIDMANAEFGTSIVAEEFIARRDAMYEVICVEDNGPQAMPGTAELLDWLESEGIPWAVASAASHRKLHFNLVHSGLAPRFPVALDGDMVPMAKPRPDLYLLAAKTLGVDPRDTLVVEDSLNGLRAGIAAGATVAAIRGTHPDEELRTLTRHIYDSPGALVEALRSGSLRRSAVAAGR